MSMTGALSTLRRLVRHDDGQDLTEYGLLMLLVAVVAISSVKAFGDVTIANVWTPAETLAARLADLF
jgi:Flp pilus assembly pilin Flp